MVSKKRKKRYEGENQVQQNDKTRDSVLVTPASQKKCKHGGLMDELRKVVKEANKVAYYGSMLANAHVTRCLEQGLTVPDVNQDFYVTCLCLVSSGTEHTIAKANKIGLMETFYDLFGKEKTLYEIEGTKRTKKNPKQPPARAYSHYVIPAYTAINMATVAGNYNTVALFDHMVPYIRAKYDIVLKGHAKFVCGRITKDRNPTNYVNVPNSFTQYTREELDHIINNEHHMFHAALKNGELLRYRYNMMKTIQEKSTDERFYNGFTLLPVRTMGVKFIDLDINTIRGIWGRLSPCRFKRHWLKPGTSGPHEELEAKWHAWNDVLQTSTSWSDWLDVPKRGKGWVQGKLVRTNGYEFHFLFEKNKERGAKRAKPVPRSHQFWESDWDPTYTFNNTDNIDTSDPYNFAAADVGHHNLFTAVSPTGLVHANGTPEMEKRNYTKQRYNHESKRIKLNKKVQRAKNEIALGYEAMMSEHTLKTPSYDALKLGIDVRFLAWDTLYDTYGTKQILKLKAEARMAEKRAIEKMLKWITWGGTKPLGVGDCSKTTGFKGTSPGGPVKKIKRYGVKRGYNIVSVKEAYTSKRSPTTRGVDMKKLKVVDRATGEVKQVRGVLICPGSGKTWDRDFSASINIFDIFYNHQVLGGQRPWHLTKDCGTRPNPGTWYGNWVLCV